MSGVTTTIKIDLDRLGLREIEDVLGPENRAELNTSAALAVREVTRGYLLEQAGQRHATADRLGATHSGHLEDAWRAVEGSPIEADGSGATLVLNVPGLGRAFHDVTIVPKAAKALTLPVAALAYNRRAGEFGDQLYVWQSRTTGNAFLAMRQADKQARPLLLYLLVRSVTQEQDRTLLPSDEQWQEAADRAAIQWVNDKISEIASS